MLLIYYTLALAEYFTLLSDGKGLIRCTEPPLMKHKQEMQKAHLGRSAERWLAGSSFCSCQPQIQMIRHEA